ncbi:MAG TPA: C1 family peptidase, partial [Kiritimatiellia bacterium]|nr:C1 family peptidase [Kiritimatiellia bacterium]
MHGRRPSPKTIAGAVLLLAAAWMVPPVLALPAAVDLSRWQTPVKNQWGRGNCFIHATVAAMEAAYKRAGSGDLDLSELFSDYVGQLFFLETVAMNGPWYTTTMRVPTAAERETSIQSDHAMSVESGAPGMVLAIPEEKYLPYNPRPHDLGGHADKNDPFWANQFAVSSFNLDPANLPYSALSAPRYYQVRSVEWLPKDDARNPAAIEAVLAGGHEVIWDFRMAGDYSGAVWRYAGPAGDAGPHRMLLIGYDRTDPQNPYFLVKNSWGDVGVYDTNDCFTRIEYRYLEYGEWASYVSAVEPPKPWPELSFIGRWHLEWSGHSGTLDVYHLPGMMQKDFDHNQFKDEAGRRLEDRRLGTFYLHDDPNQAHRVNGIVRGRALALYVDFDQPAARWDRLQGWKIDFTLDPRTPHR